MKRLLTILTIGLATLPLGSASSGTLPAPVAAQVDAVFAAWDKPDSPGCALGIVKNGEFVYRRGYGMANLEYDAKLSSKSVFYIASTSKQFTAASIMLLVRQSKLSLDDDIRKYLPEIPQYERPILVKNLVHHTSGLRDYLELMMYADRSVEDEFNNGDAVRLLSRQKGLNFTPGAQYQYSNSNYVLMAEVVRRVSGKSLREFAADAIFKPLGMASSRFDDAHRQILKQRVVSYAEEGPHVFRHFIKSIDAVGDGNLLTSVEDLARWDRNFYDERVGGTGFTGQMVTRGRLTDGSEIDYAAGLVPETYRGLSAVSHGGGFLGFRTQLLRFPAQRASVICLCNLGSIDADLLTRKVADIYLAHEGVQLGQPQERPAYKPDPPPAPGPALSDAQMREYSGSYRSEELDVTYAVSAENGQLRFLSRRPVTLASIGKDEFHLPGLIGVQFKFLRDGRGRITGLNIDSKRIKHLGFAKS